MLKRYLVFAGDTYYPNGGWHDFWYSFDTQDDAIEIAKRFEHFEWAHVIDINSFDPSNMDRSHAQVWPTS